jgi:hypothetical protein
MGNWYMCMCNALKNDTHCGKQRAARAGMGNGVAVILSHLRMTVRFHGEPNGERNTYT